MRTLVVIPARYGSTRFPGKPLALIAGRSMVSRVADVARIATQALENAAFVVATDDGRVETHCLEQGLPVCMTDPDLATGTDRALAAARAQDIAPDLVINLQGDAPFTPPETVVAIAETLRGDECDVATPVVRLTWEALDALRSHKQAEPFSGTTCIAGPDGNALWFSKNIIPALRKEAALRATSNLSPVLRHIGLYGFTLPALQRFAALPESPYEALEGLEQLRLLENGLTIRVVEVAEPDVPTSGVDTPADLAAVEALLARQEKGARS